MIKKYVTTILCTLMLFSFFCQTAFGANNVSDIAVDVVLYDDGSAHITQTWNANFHEGTESYIPIENLDGMSLSDFLVSDENGPYTYNPNWNINEGFEEKAGKYGIVNTSGGYELCWGITEYGQKRYAIEYKIHNFVGSYTDYDGFNFQFINPGMSTLPTDVIVKIKMHNGINLDTDNAAIWAFGYHGQIQFQGGQVVAYTEEALSSSRESIIIMMQLSKGLITPIRVVEKSFGDVKEEAFEGSDYGTGDDNEGIGLLGIIIAMLVAGLFLSLLGVVLAGKAKRSKKIRDLYQEAEYFRDAPLEGNLEATFVLAKDFDQTKEDQNLIGSAFLKLISTGCLEPIGEKTTGFFGREKESISLKLMHPPESQGITAKLLYELVEIASGSDKILQEKEFEKYCKSNYKALMKIIEEAENDGETTLIEWRAYDSSKKAKPLGLSKGGEGLLLEIMGFKKYLLEFSLIGERTTKESVIWQDYLTFAALLGIADKAIEQFKKAYPEMATDGNTFYGPNPYLYYYFLSNRFATSSYRAAQSAQAARTSGGGGMASFGGGGGFSGGGFGGGTR
ncbi:MAG: DUF2207 domain-containing protein [Peptostreptococcales bacterium]|jgi:hypothetical protein